MRKIAFLALATAMACTPGEFPGFGQEVATQNGKRVFETRCVVETSLSGNPEFGPIASCVPQMRATCGPDGWELLQTERSEPTLRSAQVTGGPFTTSREFFASDVTVRYSCIGTPLA